MRVVKLGTGPLPTAPLVSVDRINTGDFHDQFVGVRATIRRVVEHLDPAVEQLSVDASSRYGPLNVILLCPKHQQPTVKQWENVEVEISGVVSGEANDRSQLRGSACSSPPSPRSGRTSQPCRQHSTSPHRTFASCCNTVLRSRAAPRRGSTSPASSLWVVLRAADLFGQPARQPWVRRTPQQPQPVQPGDELDVIGFIAGGADGVWLEDGIHRLARRAVPFAPRMSTAKKDHPKEPTTAASSRWRVS